MDNNSNMISHSLVGQHYGFSALDLNELGAERYTLVTIAVDESPSTANFKREMEECIKQAIEGCKGTYADYLLVRVVAFSDVLREIHGFKMLQDCKPSDYDKCLRGGGGTLLFASAYNSIKAAFQYGKNLSDQDYGVNAINIIITDGMDNMSDSENISAEDVAKAVEEAQRGEYLESIINILVGVGVGRYQDVQAYLDSFKDKSKMDQYVSIADATSDSFSRLGGFISKSVSSQSQALGTGSASQLLQF